MSLHWSPFPSQDPPRMKIKNLHSWDVTTAEARDLQIRLAPKVIPRGGKKKPRVVAGCDIGLTKTTAYAGIVLLAFPTLEVIDTFTIEGPIPFPYVPGLLSFREAPILLELFKKVTPEPDLVFFDGQGLAHPRRFGLACHMGLFLDVPTIGCAKSKLVPASTTRRAKRGENYAYLRKTRREKRSVRPCGPATAANRFTFRWGTGSIWKPPSSGRSHAARAPASPNRRDSPTIS